MCLGKVDSSLYTPTYITFIPNHISGMPTKTHTILATMETEKLVPTYLVTLLFHITLESF